MKRSLVFLAVLPTLAVAQLASQEWGKTAGAHRIHAKAEFLAGLPMGPFAKLPDGNLVTVEDADNAQHALISKDDGKTWVITLRDVHGIDSTEVCEIVGVSETNQRVLLHRARARVRAALERHLEAS